MEAISGRVVDKDNASTSEEGRKGIKIFREQDIFHVSDGGMEQDR